MWAITPLSPIPLPFSPTSSSALLLLSFLFYFACVFSFLFLSLFGLYLWPLHLLCFLSFLLCFLSFLLSLLAFFLLCWEKMGRKKEKAGEGDRAHLNLREKLSFYFQYLPQAFPCPSCREEGKSKGKSVAVGKGNSSGSSSLQPTTFLQGLSLQYLSHCLLFWGKEGHP